MQSARLLLVIACSAAAFSIPNAVAHRHLAQKGAIADFCERTFEIDVDEASDIEARVVAASPRATRQTYQCVRRVSFLNTKVHEVVAVADSTSNDRLAVQVRRQGSERRRRR